MLRETASRRLVDAELGCEDDGVVSTLRLSFGVAPIEGFPELRPEDETGMGGELWWIRRGQRQWLAKSTLLGDQRAPVRSARPGLRCRACRCSVFKLCKLY